MTLVEPHLKHDCRGAILVIGLAMGLLMVGALWHIVSVGDAILWREQLQDAADAAAFESAVWNARGMNVIVFLNIVMSAAMAILVALRGAIIFLTALSVALNAARAACLIPVTPVTIFLCGISWGAPTVESARSALVRIEGNVREPVRRFVEGVQTAQVVVASAVPLIGVKEAAVGTSARYGIDTLGVSPALIPTAIDNRLGNSPRIGRVISLPVSRDSEAKLCEKAGEFVPNELLALLEARLPGEVFTGAGGFFRDLAGNIAGGMSSVFCGDRSLQDISQLSDMFRDLAREDCAAARESGKVTEDSSHSQEERDDLADYQDYWREGFIGGASGPPEQGYVFDTARCERERLQQVTQDYEADRGGKPARVWQYTQHGDFFLQSWGYADDEPAWLASNDRGIAFPASEGALMQAEAYTLGTAQAEIYWDTGPGSGCDGTWSGCQPETMWLMRWKARLRRVHYPAEMATRSVANIAVAEVVGAVNRGIGNLAQYGEGRLANWAQGTRWERLTHFLRGNVVDTARRIRPEIFSPITSTTQQTVGEWLAQDPPAPNQTVIH